MRTHIVARILLQLLVSAAFLGALMWRGGLGGLAGAFHGADWRWVAAAALLVAGSKTVHGVRWWLLVRRAGPVPLGGAVLVLLAASGVSVILPLRAGAALQLQVLRRRYGIERAAVAGTLMLEAFLDAAALLALALVIMPFLGPGRLISPQALFAAAAVMTAVAVATVLLLRSGGRRWLMARLPARLRVVAQSLGRGFAAAGSARSVLVLLLVTLADWALAAVALGLVGHAFGLGVPLHAYPMAEIVGNLSGAVPLTQSNVGPYELTVRETLVLFGAGGNRAAAVAVAAHAAIIVAVALTGLAAAWALRLRREDLFYINADADVGSQATPQRRDAERAAKANTGDA